MPCCDVILYPSAKLGAYRGPLSVEWEDVRMDCFHGAEESRAFVRKLDFTPNAAECDVAISKKKP